MDDKHRAPSDPSTAAESSWSLGADDSEGSYFFSGDFGWNIEPGRISADDGLLLPTHAAPIEPTAAASNNQSVSSSSSEDPPEKSTVSDEKPPPPETPSKSKKKGEKRIRQPRFAFMTKSEIDNLEDGYRWRKYGQKAVKNSPFPRSYYRCTNGKCTVKKRVERSSEDPTVVITTYEGQHCHPTVGFPRGGGIINHEAAFAGPPLSSRFYYPIQLSRENNTLSSTTSSQPLQAQHDDQTGGSSTIITPNEESSVPLCHSNNESALPRRQPPTDEGLLGDIVPPGMRNR